MRQIFIFLLFFYTTVAIAQPDLGAELRKAISGNKPALLLRLDSRNSFISNAGVKVIGVKLGASFGPHLNMGLGYNFLNPKSARKIADEMYGELNPKLSLEYASAFIEYKFYNRHPFYASIPLQLGLGSVQYRDDANYMHLRSAIVLYEAMLNGEVRFLKYFGAGAGLGYRLALLNNRSFGLNLNSPIYNLKFNLYFQELYRNIFKK